MSKSLKKLQARKLRKNGESIKDIAYKLRVSKGSVSVWCRDIKLSSKQTERLRQKMIKSSHIGRMLGTQANKQKKIAKIKKYEGIIKTNIKNKKPQILLKCFLK